MSDNKNVKLSVGDISKTGKKIISWNAYGLKHKKYLMECILCGFTQNTSIKSFYNQCKHCGNSGTKYTTKERQLWNRYKSKAKNAGIDFFISESEFAAICGQECYYCGKPPVQILNLKRSVNNKLVYNGIDRKIDILGYSVDNCVACCWKCNQAKKNYGIDEFKKMVIIWSERVDNW